MTLTPEEAGHPPSARRRSVLRGVSVSISASPSPPRRCEVDPRASARNAAPPNAALKTAFGGMAFMAMRASRFGEETWILDASRRAGRVRDRIDSRRSQERHAGHSGTRSECRCWPRRSPAASPTAARGVLQRARTAAGNRDLLFAPQWLVSRSRARQGYERGEVGNGHVPPRARSAIRPRPAQPMRGSPALSGYRESNARFMRLLCSSSATGFHADKGVLADTEPNVRATRDRAPSAPMTNRAVSPSGSTTTRLLRTRAR